MVITKTHLPAEGIPSCHASTVEQVGDDLLVAWFGGTQEAAEDVEIWCCRVTDGVASKPRRVSALDRVPCWNPVLYAPPDGPVTLFYKQGKSPSDWKTMVVTSADRGDTWSVPTELVPEDDSGGRGPVKNKPLLLPDGRLLAPASAERGQWYCFIDCLHSGVWKKHFIPLPTENPPHVIQPTLWRDADGGAHAFMRSNRGCVYRSDSADGGRTWCTAYPTALPNNNSGIDCVTLPDGRLFLVCNPIGKDWGARTPLSLLVSTDNGETFAVLAELETGEGEFSYPAIIAGGDNRLCITYTWKRKDILLCEVYV